jgi:hypothetical protein
MCTELKRLKIRYFLNVNRTGAIIGTFGPVIPSVNTIRPPPKKSSDVVYFNKSINNSRYTASNSRTMHVAMKFSDLILPSEKLLWQVRTDDKFYGLNGTGSYLTPITIGKR